MRRLLLMDEIQSAIEDDSEPEDVPSERIQTLAREILSPVADFIDGSALRYAVYTFCGAVCVEFNHIGSKRVQISIRPGSSGASYLYHEGCPDGKECEFGSDHDLSPENICRWLEWLQGPG
jgi:hypothetical protein